jgi:thymidylate synthase (FAD)
VYNQRSDSHAQKEVQDVASEIDQIIAPLYPISWDALTKGVY